jgi:hypothetical protein
VHTRPANLTRAAPPLETEYRSGGHNLERDWCQPCLTHRPEYRRAIGGYVTSRGLSPAAPVDGAWAARCWSPRRCSVPTLCGPLAVRVQEVAA